MTRGADWKRWLGAVAILAVLTACTTTGDDAGHAGDAVITAALVTPPGADPGSAWRSDMSRQMERLEMVARTGTEWAELWRRSGHAAPASLSGDSMGVAIFLGTRVSGGYTVTIDPADVHKRGDGTVQVGYREQVPGPEATVAPGQTAPFTVVLLPAETGTVRLTRLP